MTFNTKTKRIELVLSKSGNVDIIFIENEVGSMIYDRTSVDSSEDGFKSLKKDVLDLLKNEQQ